VSGPDGAAYGILPSDIVVARSALHTFAALKRQVRQASWAAEPGETSTFFTNYFTTIAKSSPHAISPKLLLEVDKRLIAV